MEPEPRRVPELEHKEPVHMEPEHKVPDMELVHMELVRMELVRMELVRMEPELAHSKLVQVDNTVRLFWLLCEREAEQKDPVAAACSMDLAYNNAQERAHKRVLVHSMDPVRSFFFPIRLQSARHSPP